ncbi:MAG: tryptophan synthase subunit alpha [Dehalococcoidia bacterium]
MNRVKNLFKMTRETNRAALSLYITAGYPDLEATSVIIKSAIDAGADMIEIGVPYSDPLADGTTIQNASTAALSQGVTLQDCLDLSVSLRTYAPDTPIILMGYYNPFLQYGIQDLAKTCKSCGVDGLIVPDLPPEESNLLENALNDYGINLIYLLAPTSGSDRITQVIKHTKSFIYCVSVAGVTGARSTLDMQGIELVKKVKQETDMPVALGFGISTPLHVREVSGVADAVIIGSAFVDKINKNLEGDLAEAIKAYVSDLKEGL